jgi:uncharacterized protein YqgV (UPF0045/DUF77 family)
MAHHTAEHVVAEVAVEPVAEGGIHGQLITKAVEALGGPEITVKVGPLSTTLEGALDDVLHAVGRAHKAIADSADRIITTVRIESKPAGIGLAEREAKAAGMGTAL